MFRTERTENTENTEKNKEQYIYSVNSVYPSRGIEKNPPCEPYRGVTQPPVTRRGATPATAVR